MASNNSPFVEGNNWRFTGDNQPKRRLTIKQLEMKLAALLNATSSELKALHEDKEQPQVLRTAAESLMQGKSIEVMQLINEMRNGRDKGKG